MTQRLLIVSPSFHGYHASIARAFTKLGYDAVAYRYDAVDSTPEKLWNKARYELPTRLLGGDAHQSAETVSRRAAARVRDVDPDVVLVVRGDTLTEDFWQVAAHGGRPVVVWMYDEMRRTSFDAGLVARYARIASYSARDVQTLIIQGVEAAYVPLGYDDTAEPTRSDEGAGVVSFVGAPSPKRRQALLALHDAGLPVRAWGRGWSDHPFDRARTWRLRTSGLPNGRDRPGSVAHAIMTNSLATLNIHGDQDGFTMRTFEAAGSGGVQLIDRADVSDFYVPGQEVLVFENRDELLECARRAVARPRDFGALRTAARSRTLAEHTLTHRADELRKLWM